MRNAIEESTLGQGMSAGGIAPPAQRDGSRRGSSGRAWVEVRQRVAHRPARRIGRWEWPILATILAVTTALNCIGLASQGYANSYYAATVRSMLTSWHNFFFASYDPGGFVAVDKPPVGFWVQATFAKVLGFHGWSLLLPQALAGVASVAILWWLVRRVWGPTAGIVAALALAVTPISVVTNRNNTIDSLLVLCVLGAVWALTRAIESTRHPLRWLLFAATLVGVGFNIKMLQAYLVLPALWAAYLVVARPRPYARIGHLVLATAVLLAVSLSWAVAVDLTPADQRPYVGSSETNSVLELAFGYNGLQRLLGRNGQGGLSLASFLSSIGSQSGTNGVDGAVGGGGGVGGASENGAKGMLRLLNQQLGGQIGWMLPLAIAGLLAAAWQVRPRRWRFWRFATNTSGAGPLRRRRASVIIWGGWFLTMAIFFSYAGFYHRYYLTMLAPGVAALAGIGVAALWQIWRMRGWQAAIGLALPVALVGTAIVQRDILANYPTWSARLATPILVVSAAAALVLAVAWSLRRRAGRWAIYPARVALAVGIAALLVTPAVWSGISVEAASDGVAAGLPAAGPAGSAGFGGMPGGATGQARNAGGMPITMMPPTGTFPGGAIPGGGQLPAGGQFPIGGNMGQTSAQMLRWLIANRGDAEYILAVTSSQQASSIIIETGLPVMATGGFSGGDQILTADSLAQIVQDGTVRYFMAGGGGPGGGMPGATGRSGNTSFSVSNWVTQNCAAVSATAWGGTGTSQLYDCGVVK